MKLIGRISEIRELKRYHNSTDPEFLVIYGRRRVGKTYLVKQFFENRFFFYLTGVSPIAEVKDGKRSLFERNLECFHSALCDHGITSDVKLSSWMEAFDRLKAGIKNTKNSNRKVIFLDEMPCQ